MKYPWIPKEYYAAVMFACKMLREGGFFNRSVTTAANYYGVDPDVLAEHVRARQAAGQRGKKRGTYKTYRFKGTALYQVRERDCDEKVFDVKINALSIKNARKRLDEVVMGRKIDPFDEDLIYDFEIDGEEVSNDG